MKATATGLRDFMKDPSGGNANELYRASLQEWGRQNPSGTQAEFTKGLEAAGLPAQDAQALAAANPAGRQPGTNLVTFPPMAR